VLSSTSMDQVLAPGQIIPDGQGGVLATWTVMPSNPPQWDPANPQHPFKVSHVVGGTPGAPYDLPFTPKSIVWGKWPALVLGENGIAFGTGPTTTLDGTNTNLSELVSFNVSSGAPNWIYQTATQSTLTIVAAASDGGVVAKTSDGNFADTIVDLDASGNSSINASASVGTNTDYSWWGDLNASINGATVEVAAQRRSVNDRSPAPIPQGNPSHNGKDGAVCPLLDSPANTKLEPAYSALITFLGQPCAFCTTSVFQPLNTSQAEFSGYLNQGHDFCDGTKSQAPGGMIGATESTVSEYFLKHVGAPDLLAAVTAKRQGADAKRSNLKVFFVSANIASNSQQDNESMEFHEALHGFSGLGDGGAPPLTPVGLCDVLGATPETKIKALHSDCWSSTQRITDWIEDNIIAPLP
jgi:hypothetical protein